MSPLKAIGEGKVYVVSVVLHVGLEASVFAARRFGRSDRIQ